MPRLGIVRLGVGPRLPGLHGLREIALPVVEARQKLVAHRVGGSLGGELLQDGLGFLVAALVLVEPRQGRVVAGFVGIDRDEFQGEGLGLGEIIHLVGPVGRDQILVRTLPQHRGLRLVVVCQLLDGFPVVFGRFRQVGIVLRFTLPARFEHAVVAVPQVEVGESVLGVVVDCLLVVHHGARVIAPPVGQGAVLEGLERPNVADRVSAAGAGGQAQPCDQHHRPGESRLHAFVLS